MSSPPPTKSQTRKSVSFRTSLLRNLIILILSLAIAILTVSIIGARNAMRTLCQDLVTSGTDRVETELRRFFGPIPPVLHIFQEWSAQGLLDHGDHEDLNNLLAPVLESIPQVAGISIGDEEGHGYMIARDPANNGFQNQIVTPESAGKTSRWIQWQELDGPREERIEEDRYDPRYRPWYLNLENPLETDLGFSDVYWTDPYPFFSTRAPGITTSIKLHEPSGIVRVIAIDILIENITSLTSMLEISPNSFVVITTNDGRTIGLPGHPKFDDPEVRQESFLKAPSDLGIPLFAEASRRIRETIGIDLEETVIGKFDPGMELPPFRWDFRGDAWWTYVRPCEIEDGPQFLIGVTVPESDFLGALREGRNYYFGFAFAALLVAVFMSTRLSQRYSSPIQALIQQSERLRTLNTDRVEAPPTEILEIAQLNDAQESMRLALDSFAKYVPSDVVRELLDKGEAAVIGGRTKSMSILFTDIEGFTSISEKMTPTELTAHMADYFDHMIGILTDNDGVIDKLIGDAILALWSAPRQNDCHARDAVRSALRCHEYLRKANLTWEERDLPRLPTRFGISTGEVVVGNVGASNRLSYTALGDAVNLASRLEGANKFYGTRIIASANTRAEAGDEFAWRKLDQVRVKGRSEPELIYELLGETGKVEDEILQRARAYEEAFENFLTRNFSDARKALDELAKEFHGDRSYRRLADLCTEALQNPPPDQWDGVSEFKQK